MKINGEFLLKEISGQWILMPINTEDQSTVKIMTLTASAALLWTELEKGTDNIEDLAKALLKEYDIEYRMAVKDSSEFIIQLKEHDIIE